MNGRGQSELFYDDVLGLDNALYRPMDEATLKAINEDADKKTTAGFRNIFRAI